MLKCSIALHTTMQNPWKQQSHSNSTVVIIQHTPQKQNPEMKFINQSKLQDQSKVTTATSDDHQQRPHECSQKLPASIQDSLHWPKPTCIVVRKSARAIFAHKKRLAEKEHSVAFTHLLCTSVYTVRGNISARAAASTCNLTEVSTCHESIIALAPASLQP